MDPVKTFERKLGQTNGVITSDMWPSGLVDIDNICKNVVYGYYPIKEPDPAILALSKDDDITN